jgi:hypothetical protein
LASAYELKGRFADALAEARKMEEFGAQERGRCHTARIQARMGKIQEARQTLASGCASTTAVGCAATALALGDREKAFAELERAIPEHDNHLIWLRVEPMFDPIRNDPRFLAILKQINLR